MMIKIKINNGMCLLTKQTKILKDTQRKKKGIFNIKLALDFY